MTDALPTLPDDGSLARGLTSVLGGAGLAPVTVLHRVPNPLASTFPSEVVTCRLGNGEHLRVLCKFGGHDHHAFGHRGGVSYEAEVYRHVLSAAGSPVPQFYGAAAAGPAGEAWLAIGYLENSPGLNSVRDVSFWGLAAAWCGRFHAEHEAPAPVRIPSSFLIEYDAAYYAGWARRTAEYAAEMRFDFPWLGHLCRRAEAALPELLEAPRTVIHGEYYPKNILLNGRTVYPVDWESAAVARGEIDLATLTDHCDEEVVSRCEAAYRRARWPDGAPPTFVRALEMSRLYVHLRWLGAAPGPKLRRRFRRYEEIRALGERLGLI